jgi:hypothetical protein
MRHRVNHGQLIEFRKDLVEVRLDMIRAFR